MPTWLGNQISLSPHSGHATLHSFGILIAPHPCVVRFHPYVPLVQVRTQLDKGNTSVSERYKTRLLEPEEVTHCQNLTFRHLGTGSNFPIFMPWLFLLHPEADSFCSKWNFLLNRLFIQNFSSPVLGKLSFTF